MFATAFVWRLLVGHISRKMPASFTSWITSSFPAMRTPCPILDAPMRIAVFTSSASPASPAWMVKGTFSSFAFAKSAS